MGTTTSQTSKAPLVIIGGGPGGYAAAFKAAELGLDVTVVDPAAEPGGVCLHRGCIPSRALLHAARLIRETEESANMGLDLNPPRLDIDRLRSWKNDIVTSLTGGLGSRMLHSVAATWLKSREENLPADWLAHSIEGE